MPPDNYPDPRQERQRRFLQMLRYKSAETHYVAPYKKQITRPPMSSEGWLRKWGPGIVNN